MDATGMARPAPLIYVSPGQVNIVVPDGTAPGTATVIAGGASGTVQVAAVAPGLFAMAGTKVAAATAERNAPGDVPVFDCSSGTCKTTPIPVDTGAVYLTLYGTGIRGAKTVTATVGGVAAPVTYAGAQGQYPGFDQVNVQLPAALAGKGVVDVVVTADGQLSNAVQVAIR